jgi:hypothetical protein
MDGRENYGVARLKTASLSISLSLPTQRSSKSLPFNEVLWCKKEGRNKEIREGRKEGRKEVYKATDDKILINDLNLM